MDKLAQFMKLRALPKTKHSGLQLKILKLYRDFLRAIKIKASSSENRAELTQIVRTKFNDRQSISKNDIQEIEYYFQQGERQLQQFSRSSIVAAKSITIKRE